MVPVLHLGSTAVCNSLSMILPFTNWYYSRNFFNCELPGDWLGNRNNIIRHNHRRRRCCLLHDHRILITALNPTPRQRRFVGAWIIIIEDSLSWVYNTIEFVLCRPCRLQFWGASHCIVTYYSKISSALHRLREVPRLSVAGWWNVVI